MLGVDGFAAGALVGLLEGAADFKDGARLGDSVAGLNVGPSVGSDVGLLEGSETHSGRS